VRALLLSLLFGSIATAAPAQSLEVIGYSGYLGEWDLSATVVQSAQGGEKEYFGQVTMKHVGLCTQDGPEEKTGEMRMRISASQLQLEATLSVAGVACSYKGQLADSYNGTMTCPDREAVPLKLWLK